MKRFIIAFVFLNVLVANTGYAQVITANQFQTKADAAFELKDYNTALSHYMTILNDEPDRADLYWKTAESARYTRRYTVAEKYYEALSKNPELSKTQPLLDYKLATVKKSLEKYDQAIALFQKYTTTAGDISQAATAEIESTTWAKEMIKTKPYEVIHLDDKVNTIYIDAAPVRFGNEFFYTSAYFKTPDGAPVTNVYSSNLVDKALRLAINSQADGVHTAYYAPNTEGSRLYYNLCEQDETGSFMCQIYVREKSADGTWGKPSLLDTNTINIKGFTATQPNVGFDKVKGKDVLYFVSDRRGGKGGLDIWAADIEDNGIVNAPVNLSAINTSKEDITPFYMNGPQVLLFSTEGGKSLGGFDIHISERGETGFSEPKNIGYPINTSYDDMYPSFDAENAKYYFVSNRPGGLCGSDKQDCVCNDIYEHNIMVKLDVSTFLAGENIELNGCRVDLVDVETGKVVKQLVNENANTFEFAILPNKKYQLIGSKNAYTSDTITFNTYISGSKLANEAATSDLNITDLGLYAPVTAVTKKLVLKPKLRLDIYVFDKINRKPLNGATVDIRNANGKIQLASETLPGNFMTWGGLEFGKTYNLSGTKVSFDKDSSSVSVEDWSSNVTKFVYTDSLYLIPFSGLPLTLYYDNDYPNPRTRAMTTVFTYGETYLPYYKRKTEYLTAYYKDNNDVSASGANEIADFFENNIKLGYDKLNEYSNKLIEYLTNGYGMEIVLEGYASPLAENEYNRILTSRRVSAVINHFEKYQNGIFRDYLKNGQLRLLVRPYGEEKAAKGVSDDAKNRRKSVFSVPAMKERKVEIKEINVFQFNPKDGYSIGDALGIYLDTKALSTPPHNTTLGDIDRVNSYSIVTKGEYTKKGGSSVNVMEETKSGYVLNVSETKKVNTQQRHELVFVDAYTGEVLKDGTSVELFDKYAGKIVGKAKRRGKKYIYNVDLTKEYVVKGSAVGYSEGVVDKSSSYTEGGKGNESDTMFLSPFGGLPLPLYFDNDKPSKSGDKERTELTDAAYNENYRQFISRKKDFIYEYNKILAANGADVSSDEMKAFFEKEVKKGFDQLEGFTKIMKSYLKNGCQLEIILEGYASPLANEAYNQKLAERRVNSVINYLSDTNGKSFNKYIKSGQLKITVQPHGEVNPNVSDDENNASSIFGIDASRERKVVVKDIIILNNVHYKK